RARRVTWSSAGHPPAFLCPANGGAIEALDSTSMLLGPVAGNAYDAQQQSRDISDGDVIIAYTDGAIECRDAFDRQLGIEGLKGFILRARGQSMPAALDAVMAGVDRHRAGPADDDILLLGLSLSISAADAAPNADL